jgi:hypothetical protein
MPTDTGRIAAGGRVNDEFEAGEVCDRDARLSEWRRPDGTPSALGVLALEAEERCPPDTFDDVDPDEQEFHEATGNEGASFERAYRRTAPVLWPRDRFLAVLNQAGRPATLPYLSNLTERAWRPSGATTRPPSALHLFSPDETAAPRIMAANP